MNKKAALLLAVLSLCILPNAYAGKGSITIELVNEGHETLIYSGVPVVQLKDLQTMSSGTSTVLSCTLDGRAVDEIAVPAGEKRVLKCTGEKLPEYTGGPVLTKVVWPGKEESNDFYYGVSCDTEQKTYDDGSKTLKVDENVKETRDEYCRHCKTKDSAYCSKPESKSSDKLRTLSADSASVSVSLPKSRFGIEETTYVTVRVTNTGTNPLHDCRSVVHFTDSMDDPARSMPIGPEERGTSCDGIEPGESKEYRFKWRAGSSPYGYAADYVNTTGDYYLFGSVTVDGKPANKVRESMTAFSIGACSGGMMGGLCKKEDGVKYYCKDGEWAADPTADSSIYCAYCMTVDDTCPKDPLQEPGMLEIATVIAAKAVNDAGELKDVSSEISVSGGDGSSDSGGSPLEIRQNADNLYKVKIAATGYRECSFDIGLFKYYVAGELSGWNYRLSDPLGCTVQIDKSAMPKTVDEKPDLATGTLTAILRKTDAADGVTNLVTQSANTASNKCGVECGGKKCSILQWCRETPGKLLFIFDTIDYKCVSGTISSCTDYETDMQITPLGNYKIKADVTAYYSLGSGQPKKEPRCIIRWVLPKVTCGVQEDCNKIWAVIESEELEDGKATVEQTYDKTEEDITYTIGLDCSLEESGNRYDLPLVAKEVTVKATGEAIISGREEIMAPIACGAICPSGRCYCLCGDAIKSSVFVEAGKECGATEKGEETTLSIKSTGKERASTEEGEKDPSEGCGTYRCGGFSLPFIGQMEYFPCGKTEKCVDDKCTFEKECCSGRSAAINCASCKPNEKCLPDEENERCVCIGPDASPSETTEDIVRLSVMASKDDSSCGQKPCLGWDSPLTFRWNDCEPYQKCVNGRCFYEEDCCRRIPIPRTGLAQDCGGEVTCTFPERCGADTSGHYDRCGCDNTEVCSRVKTCKDYLYEAWFEYKDSFNYGGFESMCTGNPCNVPGGCEVYHDEIPICGDIGSKDEYDLIKNFPEASAEQYKNWLIGYKKAGGKATTCYELNDPYWAYAPFSWRYKVATKDFYGVQMPRSEYMIIVPKDVKFLGGDLDDITVLFEKDYTALTTRVLGLDVPSYSDLEGAGC